MWNYFSKFLAAFSYASGFILAIVCAVYVVIQYSNSSVKLSSHDASSSSLSTSKNKKNYSKDIEVKHLAKLSNFTNYADEGMREEFIFTGELFNSSDDKNYEKIMVEIDLYDAENKFIFKCGGWDGVGLIIRPQETKTFQKHCYRMPVEITTKYSNHKVVVKQRNF